MSSSTVTPLDCAFSIARAINACSAAPMAVGEHQVDVDAQAWPAGCYWYDLTTGAEHLSRKLVVVR